MISKAIIFDASSLISLSMNGLLPLFEKLKQNFKGEFIITKEVKYEIIDRPIKSKKFELEAMHLQKLLDKKILILPSELNISEKEITKESEELMNIANSTFETSEKPIHLIDLGETSCLVLSKILNEKKIKNLLAIDERTIRMLCEKPENLKDLYKKKFHMPVKYKKENLKHFSGFKIIRSCELVYIAHKKGLTTLSGKQALDAYMYALKFKGCSISNDEIEEIKKLS